MLLRAGLERKFFFSPVLFLTKRETPTRSLLNMNEWLVVSY